MRIAILLTGHFRTWNTTKFSFFNHILNVNKNHTIDIFIHTWNTMGYSSVGFDTIKSQELTDLDKEIIHKYGCSKHSLQSPLLDVDSVISELKPKSIVVENENSMKEKIYNNISNYQDAHDNVCFIPNSYANYRNVFMCNNLKTEFENINKFKYDIVIRTRPDVLYKRDMIFTDDIKNKCVYMNNNYVNDILFYGDSYSMDIFNHIDNRNIDPHLLLSSYIDSQQLSIIGLDMNICLLRHNNLVIDYQTNTEYFLNNETKDIEN